MIESITAIIVALIGASHLWDRRRNKRVEDKQDVVLGKISTNHGKEPWQYLEMIAEIRKSQLADNAVVLELLAEHTAQDHANFEQLRRELARLGGQAGL